MFTFIFSLFCGQVSSQRYKYGVWGQQNFDLDKNAELRNTILSSFFYLRQVKLLQSEAFFGGVGVRLMKSPIPVQLLSVTRLFFFQFTPCKIPNFPIGVGGCWRVGWDWGWGWERDGVWVRFLSNFCLNAQGREGERGYRCPVLSGDSRLTYCANEQTSQIFISSVAVTLTRFYIVFMGCSLRPRIEKENKEKLVEFTLSPHWGSVHLVRHVLTKSGNSQLVN